MPTTSEKGRLDRIERQLNPGSIAPAFAQPNLARVLTRKEMEVLQHVAKGESNKEISSQLCRSTRTVECHVATILGKLGVRNRVMAAMIFMAQFAMFGGNENGT